MAVFNNKLGDKIYDWVYSDLQECMAQHPDCKLWFFGNAVGSQLHFIAGELQYLYENYHVEIEAGHIGFVTISGSGYPIMSMYYEKPSFMRWDGFYTMFYYKSVCKNGYSNFYDFAYRWSLTTFLPSTKPINSNIKHIVITSKINDMGKVRWFYHDCSHSSTIPDHQRIRTVLASSCLGCIDPVSNWEGFPIDGQGGVDKHMDGFLWYKAPEGTVDLLECVGIKWYSISFLFKSAWGFTLCPRNTTHRWWVDGYKKTKEQLLMSDSSLSFALSKFTKTPVKYTNSSECIFISDMNLGNSYFKMWNVITQICSPTKIYKDVCFVSRLVFNNRENIGSIINTIKQHNFG